MALACCPVCLPAVLYAFLPAVLLACCPVCLLSYMPAVLYAFLPAVLLACCPVCLLACCPVGLLACCPVGLLACMPVCLLACCPVCLLACCPVCLLSCCPVCLLATHNYISLIIMQIDHLGLANEVVPVLPSHKGAQRRLIYTNKDGLLEVPSSLSWLFRAKPPFTRPLLPAVLREPFQKKKRADDSSENGDESVYSFIMRRLGKEVGTNTGLCVQASYQCLPSPPLPSPPLPSPRLLARRLPHRPHVSWCIR